MLVTQFLYLCKSNEAVLKRNILNPEISQGKLQSLEWKDLVLGLENLYEIFFLECVDNRFFLQN